MQKKDKLINRIVGIDYNDELEEVLEKKPFQENAKNLLLNILYKIEISYKDYEHTKRNVISKAEFLQKIINVVKNNCDEIKLVQPNSEESTIIGNKTFLVEKERKRIICLPIERKLLYSIAKISKNKEIIKDKYFLINKTLTNLINVGNNINTVEPLRDFNGYSWTTITREIESVEYNIIYQNLRILVEEKFLENWITNKEFIIDYMELFESKLEDEYGIKEKTKIIELLSQISILLEIKFDKKSNEEMIKIKEEIEQKLNKIKDNIEFTKQSTKEKKELAKQIKRIDETINNKEMLQQEYIKRNENLPIEKKIFSSRILSQMMIIEREKYIEKMEELNQLMNPQGFIKFKTENEEKEKYLKLLDIEDKDAKLKTLIIDMQKELIKCYKIKIKRAETKQQLINLIYEFRYYCLLPVDNEKEIKSIKELQSSIKEIKQLLIEKAQKQKIINLIATEKEINYEILKNIFEVRIIELEDLHIKLTKEKDKFYIQLFDENEFEQKILLDKIENIDKKELQIKINKKIKIFN